MADEIVPCYVIARIHVADLEAYQPYMAGSGASIRAHGGKILVRGGPADWIEGGDGPVGRVVVIEFPDRATATAWYNSDEYQAVVGIRHANSSGTLIMVDGAPRPAAPIE